MDNLVITVARGFGSCGKRIAKQIADDLGIHCYENRILMLASQMSGLDEEVFAEVNEKLRSQNVFSAFLKGLPMQRSPKVEDRKFVSNNFSSDTNFLSSTLGERCIGSPLRNAENTFWLL